MAEICGIKVSGLFAWLLWRGVYLMKMPGLNRKARIATDWLLHLFFPPELAQTRAAFESAIRNQHYEPGDIIFQQGDLGDCVYVIEEGECDVLCERKGEQEHLAMLGRGAYFGEMALLSNKTRSATLRARTAMDVLIVPKADFNKLRESVPAFASVFTELAAQRAEAGSPHVFADLDMPGSLPGIPTGALDGNSGQRALFQCRPLP